MCELNSTNRRPHNSNRTRKIEASNAFRLFHLKLLGYRRRSNNLSPAEEERHNQLMQQEKAVRAKFDEQIRDIKENEMIALEYVEAAFNTNRSSKQP